ncbi:hypothetical protein B0A48_09820 [Cryoendolithus antarcticus]|uniref:Histone H4 n=1 Tax=Cryoendolithus antarcticus TaxID=1507870 RepID=A0A1V8T2T1_9PEZI|nr:hypothetical protein B0A48_09820 [Cryoendolithus antarcticus]
MPPSLSRNHNLLRSDVSGLPGSSARPAVGVGKGKGKKGLPSSGGLKTKGPAKRHRKILRETIQGITRPDIRRLARRGGVKRISAGIYDETRGSLRDFLTAVLRDCAAIAWTCNRKTITVTDVVYALSRRGHTLYGFGSSNTRGRGGD